MSDKKKKGKERSASAPPKDEVSKCWTCMICKKISSDPNGKMLECERCIEHFCIKCTKVTEAEYDFMASRADLHWFCGKCDEPAMQSVLSDKELEEKILKYTMVLDERMLELETKLKDKADKKEVDERMNRFDDRMNKMATKHNEIVTTLKAEIQEIRKNSNELEERIKMMVSKKVDDELDKKLEDETTWASIVSRHVDQSVEVKFENVKDDFSKIKDSITEAKASMKETKDFLSEEKDKESRKNNIIIYRMIESVAESNVDRQKDDVRACVQLVRNALLLPCDENEFKRIFRLGKKEAGKDRPLLVEFKNNVLKNHVMESLGRLKDAEDEFKRLSISHDMTKTERDETKRLVQQAKERTILHGEGEWIYRVRGNPGSMRIVRVKKH